MTFGLGDLQYLSRSLKVGQYVMTLRISLDSISGTVCPILLPFAQEMGYLAPVILKGYEHDLCSCSRVAPPFIKNLVSSLSLELFGRICCRSHR